MSHSNSPDTTSRHGLLQRVAVTLSVPVDAFGALPKEHVFHIGADGTRWLLTSDTSGVPTVCCLSARAAHHPIEHGGVAAFLAQNFDSPQGHALAALVERTLTMHLHLDMRS